MASSTSVARSAGRGSPPSRLSGQDWVNEALVLIADEGMPAVKIDRIAQRLGATKGSFYWHFTDAAGFQDAVARAFCEERERLVDSFDELEQLPPRALLLALIDILLDRNYWRLERAAREWARTNVLVSHTLTRSDKRILQLERKAFLGLGFSEADARMRTNALFCVGMGFILTGSDNVRIARRQAEGLVDLLIRP